jgi:hypothetical protein
MDIREICYIATCLLTYSMEQSPHREANRFSASQEIPHILWKPKVYFRSHKFPAPVPLLSQLYPIHTTSSHFLKIHLYIILLFRPGSPKWSLPFRFTHQNPVYASPLPHTRYMPRPSHSYVATCYRHSIRDRHQQKLKNLWEIITPVKNSYKGIRNFGISVTVIAISLYSFDLISGNIF